MGFMWLTDYTKELTFYHPEEGPGLTRIIKGTINHTCTGHTEMMSKIHICENSYSC